MYWRYPSHRQGKDSFKILERGMPILARWTERVHLAKDLGLPMALNHCNHLNRVESKWAGWVGRHWHLLQLEQGLSRPAAQPSLA
jgi:hypothetical protein